jgi:hypothetical protein
MLTAFTQRHPHAHPLPNDILSALGQPRDVEHGRLLVFAPSAVSAYQYLDQLGLAPDSRLDLKPATGEDVAALMGPDTHLAGDVYVLPVAGRNVAQVTTAAGATRHVYRVGELRHGYYYPSPPETSGTTNTEVTEAMVDAASAALSLANMDPVPHSSWLRIAIEAALQAQREGLGQ